MSKKKPVNASFLLATYLLVGFGTLIFTSAALGLLARNGASFASVSVSQLLLGLVCGSIALVVASRVDYARYRPYVPYFFLFSVFLTILTFVPHIGLSLKGASRWIVIGGFSFQPEEMLKLATVLLLASVYSAHPKEVQTFKGGLGPLFGIVGIPVVLLGLQPNTAGIIVIGIAGAAMFFAAGGRLSHIALLFCLGIALIGVAALTRPHVAQRIETFFNQSADAHNTGYQARQALIAMGSGQLVGKGFGQSVGKFALLPEPIGDSIFAIAGEEFGFIGASLLVLLFCVFSLLGLRIASRTPDPFGALVVVGIIALIAGQSFFNMASITALVPLVGVPLIFVSHGGSAMAFALLEVGIILNISRKMRTA